jgi:hypothetical protein
MFSSAQPGWTSTFSAVWMHRVFRSWTTDRLKALGAGPHHAGSFQDLQVMGDLVAELQGGYYPATREAFAQSLQNNAAEVAEATLAGMNTADDAVEARLDQLVEAVGPAVAEPHLERFRIAARGKQIEQLNSDLDAIAKVHDTVDAIPATAAWQLGFQRDYEAIAGTAAYEDAHDYIVNRRRRLLESFEGNVIARMAATTTKDEVHNLLNWSLVSETERKSSPGKAIAEAGEIHLERTRQEEEIARAREAREQQLAYFSPQERLWIKPDSLELNPPPEDQVEQPTAESLRMAFRRELVATGGKQIARDKAVVSLPLPQLADFVGLEFHVTKIELVDVVKPPPDAGWPRSAYECHYYAKIKLRQTGSLLRELRQRAGMEAYKTLLDPVVKALEIELSRELRRDVFFVTPKGWRSDTLQEKVPNLTEFVRRAGR